MKRKLKLCLLSLAFLGSLLAALFTIAELTLRYLVTDDATESRDHVRAAEYMPIKFRSHYSGVLWGVPFTTNQYGFRDEPDFPKQPDPEVFRILSLGDSIGFGLGIPAGAHYTKVLERRLNRSAIEPRFHVVNASGQGYSPSSYYVYLRHEGLDLNPDMVIADMEMCTVITNEALLQWETDPDNSDLPIAVRGGRYVVSWDGRLLATYSLGGYFFERTYVYTDLLRRSLNLAFRISPTSPFRQRDTEGVSYYDLGFDRYLLSEERLESGWEKTFTVVRGIQDLLAARGIPFVLMIMPSRYMYQDDAPAWQKYATRLMQRGVERARRSGINFVEFTEPVARGGGARLYYDFAHMTAEGNRVVGDALFDRVAPLLLGASDAPQPSPGAQSAPR